MSDTPTLKALVQPNSISAGPIPDQQSYTFLKQQGIKELKQLAGNVWSNYNDSDPGVTILDQVVYALTELGYVNSFDIADVLTQPDGSIRYQEQFFTAETILTTGPVTLDDYRRLVFDRFDSVDNLYITPEFKWMKDNSPEPGINSPELNTNSPEHDMGEKVPTGLYQVCIFSRGLMSATPSSHKAQGSEADSDIATINTDDTHEGGSGKNSNTPDITTERAELALSVQTLLNSQRNLSEYFLAPLVLTAQNISLSGEVLLTADADLTQVYQDIDQALANYVSPLIEEVGYQQAEQQGASADQIFNGPALNQGWIISQNGLGEKRDLVSIVDIITILSSVSGVMALENLTFTDSPQATTLEIAHDAVANLLLSDQFSLVKSQIQHSKSAWQQQLSDLNLLKAQLNASSIDAKVDIAPPLPEGRFRHIENYYSVQYTFPDIYGVGPNSLQSDTPDYRVAQARQLKGYLLLFDQVIANQFSQLANLNNLFSFSFSRIPSNETEYHTSINLQTKKSQGPVTPAIPMQPFARSYYCQPLYEVPDVQALLAGQNNYQYFYPDDPTDQTQRGQLVWKRFKNDPFNAYFYGLSHAQESTDEAEQRRDTMLSHLLARHGESADLYDDIIDASQWYGGEYKTRILVKTLWLQNLQQLSYRRNQGVDFVLACPLKTPGRFYLHEQDYQQLLIERATDIAPFLQAIRGKGFSHQNEVVRTLAKRRVTQLQQHLAQNGQTRKVNTAKVIKRSQAVAKALPLRDNNADLLTKQHQFSGNKLILDGTYNPSALDNDAKFTAEDYASHSTFTLKANLLLGFTQHLSSLALALVRLLADPDFSSWLQSAQSDTQSQSNGGSTTFPTTPKPEDDPLHDTSARFIEVSSDIQNREAIGDAPTNTDAKLKTPATTQRVLSIFVGQQEVMHLPAQNTTITTNVIQQYSDQLLWLAQQQGWVLVEHSLLQSTITEKTPSKLLTPKMAATQADEWYWLRASVVLPQYVLLTQQPQFSYFLSVLQQLHWPTHIELTLRQGSQSQLSTLIENYVEWHQQMMVFSGNSRAGQAPSEQPGNTSTLTNTARSANTDTELHNAQAALKTALDDLSNLAEPANDAQQNAAVNENVDETNSTDAIVIPVKTQHIDIANIPSDEVKPNSEDDDHGDA